MGGRLGPNLGTSRFRNPALGMFDRGNSQSISNFLCTGICCDFWPLVIFLCSVARLRPKLGLDTFERSESSNVWCYLGLTDRSRSQPKPNYRAIGRLDLTDFPFTFRYRGVLFWVRGGGHTQPNLPVRNQFPLAGIGNVTAA